MSLWNNTDAQASKPKYLGLGQVQAINISAGGTLYTPTNGTASATIAAPPVGGVQATATVTITAGVITGVTVTNPGAGYTTAPAVTYTTGGSAAVMTAVIQQESANGPSNGDIFFADLTEAQNASNRIKGIKTPGWFSYKEYVDSGNVTRYKVEPLIAMTVLVGASGDATDDTVVGDTAFAITTQPVDRSVTAPAATTFVVAATGATAFQWQLRPAAGGQYTNISNGGVYSTATTATLNISNTTGLNGNRYRCVVANTTAGASVTSTSGLLTVA